MPRQAADISRVSTNSRVPGASTAFGQDAPACASPVVAAWCSDQEQARLCAPRPPVPACAMAKSALHTLTARCLHRPVAHTAVQLVVNEGGNPIVPRSLELRPGTWGSKPVICDHTRPNLRFASSPADSFFGHVKVSLRSNWLDLKQATVEWG